MTGGPRDVGDFRGDGHAAVEWAASYLERVGDLPVLAPVAPGEIRERLPAAPPEDPEPFSAVLRDLDEVLLDGVTHWQHPRYFAYFATSSAPPAILAEMLAATLNAVPSIPAIGLVLVLSVDWFIGMARALGNLIGNCVATVVVAAWEGDLDREKAAKVLNGQELIDVTAG